MQKILTKNPNFWISINGDSVAGQDAANALAGAMAKLPGNPFGLSSPQNRTATDKLIDRARQLVDQPNRNDCKALVELIRYAGDLFENVIAGTNQLGVVLAGGGVTSLMQRAAAGRVTGRHETTQPIVDGFGSSGFLEAYQDSGTSPNQVRHFIGALLAGASRGMNGLAIMNANEPDPTGEGAADVRLNGVAVPLGADLQLHNGEFGYNRSIAGRDRMRQLGDDVAQRKKKGQACDSAILIGPLQAFSHPPRTCSSSIIKPVMQSCGVDAHVDAH